MESYKILSLFKWFQLSGDTIFLEAAMADTNLEGSIWRKYTPKSENTDDNHIIFDAVMVVDKQPIFKIHGNTVQTFKRGEWKDYWDFGGYGIQLTEEIFAKDYTRVANAGKKEIIIRGGEYIAVFLAPEEYADEHDILTILQGMVKRKEDWTKPWDWNWDSKNHPSRMWEEFEFITYCKKPYDLAPVQYSEDPDPDVSVLVNVTEE